MPPKRANPEPNNQAHSPELTQAGSDVQEHSNRARTRKQHADEALQREAEEARIEAEKARREAEIEAEKARKEAEENDKALERSKDNPKCIVITEEYFYEAIKNALHLAYTFQNSESHLYPIHNLLQSLASFILYDPSSTASTVLSWPQSLLRNMPAQTTTQSSPVIDLTPLFGRRIPDEGRVFLNRKATVTPTSRHTGLHHLILDFLECKPLNIRQPWLSATARHAAKKNASAHFVQLHEEAMAAFQENPKCRMVFGTLVIGIYYTLLKWETRPSAKALQDLPSLPPFPLRGVNTTDPRQITTCLKALDDQVKCLQARPLPTIIAFCQPIFLSSTPDSDADWIDSITLNPDYAEALSHPVKKFCPQMQEQPSWFGIRKNEPSTADLIELSRVKVMYEAVVKKKLIARCQEDIRSLINWNRPEPDSAPPNSKDSVSSNFSATQRTRKRANSHSQALSVQTRSNNPLTAAAREREKKSFVAASKLISQFAAKIPSAEALDAADSIDDEEFIDEIDVAESEGEGED